MQSDTQQNIQNTEVESKQGATLEAGKQDLALDATSGSSSETTAGTQGTSDVRQLMKDNRICVIIPTYNNATTVAAVLKRVKEQTDNIILVDDGCTDDTLKQVEQSGVEGVDIVSYTPNKGKGRALQQGFIQAIKSGYDYAITIDSDGQHFPEDIPLFIDAFLKHRGALLIGSRNLNEKNMPSRNTFANKFSNFWFRLQTGVKLPDTQTGYRLYPLQSISRIGPLTSRYEAELELLVMSAWRGVDIIPVPVRVYYPPKSERVSHFRPVADFLRISLLNVGLTTTALFYGLPRRIFNRHKKPSYDKTV